MATVEGMRRVLLDFCLIFPLVLRLQCHYAPIYHSYNSVKLYSVDPTRAMEIVAGGLQPVTSADHNLRIVAHNNCCIPHVVIS